MNSDNPHHTTHEFDGMIDVKKEIEDVIPGENEDEIRIKTEFDTTYSEFGAAGEIDCKVEHDERDCLSQERSEFEAQNSPEDPHHVSDMEEGGSFSCWICFTNFISCVDVKKHIFQEHDQKAFCALTKAENGDSTSAVHSQLLLFCPNDCEFVTSKLELLSLHLAYCSRPALYREGSNFMEIHNDFISTHYVMLKERFASGESRGRQDCLIDIKEEIKEEDPHTSSGTAQREDHVLYEDHLYKCYAEGLRTWPQQKGQNEQRGTSLQSSGWENKDSYDDHPCRSGSPLFPARKQLEGAAAVSLIYGDTREDLDARDMSDTHDTEVKTLRVDEHIKMHTVRKRFQCPECHKSCRAMCDLVKHMRTHTGEKPFQCGECGRSFSLKENLKRHFLRHKKTNFEKSAAADSLISGDLHACNMSDTHGTEVKTLRSGDEHIKMHTVRKRFQCSECHKSFRTTQDLVKHVRTHTGEKPFLCGECGRSFSIKQNLKRHLLSHKNTDFVSSEATDSLFSGDAKVDLDASDRSDIHDTEVKALRCGDEHIKMHTVRKRYQCTECHKSFNSMCDLVKHMRSHTGEKPFQCGECGRRFSLKENLKRHISRHKKTDFDNSAAADSLISGDSHACNMSDTHDTVVKTLRCGDEHIKMHSERKRFQCSECHTSCISMSDLVKHVRTHTGEKPFQCGECGRSFSIKQNLKRHLLSHKKTDFVSSEATDSLISGDAKVDLDARDMNMKMHTVRKRFQCTECHISCNSMSDLVKHVRTHTGEKPFQCGECGRSFSIKQNLKRHLLSHKNTDFVSSEATDSLISGDAKVCDMTDTHDNKVKTLRCSDEHIKMHTVRKRLQCPECHKSFGTKQDMVRHMRSHTGEKPFQCGVCGRNFSRKHHMEQHLARHKQTHFVNSAAVDSLISGDTKEALDACDIHDTEVDKSVIKHDEFDESVIITHDDRNVDKKCSRKFDVTSNLGQQMKRPAPADEHMKMHAERKRFQGKDCHESLMCSQDLVRRMRTHTGKKTFQCEKCDKKFKLMLHLKIHYRTHREVAFGKNRCDERHIRTNSLKKAMKYRKLCQSNFRSKDSFYCEECEKSFGCRKVFQRHMMRIHTGERPFQCGECEKSFSGQSSFRRHMRNHIKEKPYECEECGEKFSVKYNLEKHLVTHNEYMRTHKGVVTHEEKDDKSVMVMQYDFDGNVVTHYDDVDKSKNECSIELECDGKLDVTSHLPQQMRTSSCGDGGKGESSVHLDHEQLDPGAGLFVESSSDKHKCLIERLRRKLIQRGTYDEKCRNKRDSKTKNRIRPHKAGERFQRERQGKIFVHNKNDLTMCIVNNLTGEKQFHCVECNKSYAHMSDLDKHLRTHNEENPYYCEKSFACRKDFRRHMRTHMGERPFFRKHVRNHIREKAVGCEERSKKFSVKYGLNRHLTTHRQDDSDKSEETGSHVPAETIIDSETSDLGTTDVDDTDKSLTDGINTHRQHDVDKSEETGCHISAETKSDSDASDLDTTTTHVDDIDESVTDGINTHRQDDFDKSEKTCCHISAETKSDSDKNDSDASDMGTIITHDDDIVESVTDGINTHRQDDFDKSEETGCHFPAETKSDSDASDIGTTTTHDDDIVESVTDGINTHRQDDFDKSEETGCHFPAETKSDSDASDMGTTTTHDDDIDESVTDVINTHRQDDFDKNKETGCHFPAETKSDSDKNDSDASDMGTIITHDDDIAESVTDGINTHRQDDFDKSEETGCHLPAETKSDSDASDIGTTITHHDYIVESVTDGINTHRQDDFDKSEETGSHILGETKDDSDRKDSDASSCHIPAETKNDSDRKDSDASCSHIPAEKKNDSDRKDSDASDMGATHDDIVDESVTDSINMSKSLSACIKEKIFQCERCGKTFGFECNLERHSRTSECAEFGTSMTGQMSMQRHLHTGVGGKPYGCEDCGKSFNLKCNLERHKRTRECSVYLRSLQLYGKMETQGRDKPFECEICGMTFNLKCNLERHLKIH